MRFPFWRRSRQKELGEEIESHLRMAAREREEQGENPRQAEQSARREFGNAGLIREVTRDQWGWRWLESLFQDLRYCLRRMRRAPLLTFTVILALAAGIGLNVAVFTLLDGFWLRAPVEKDPGSFVQAIPSYSGWFDTENEFHGFTVKDYEAIRTRAKSLKNVAAFDGGGNVKLDNDPTEIGLGMVSCDFFNVYGWELRLGRTFLPQECTISGSTAVVVISEALWRNRFAADPHIIGKSIRINQHPYTVIGVISSRSPLWMKGDLWVPYTMQAEFLGGYDAFKKHPDYPWLSVVGRLKPGYSQVDAGAELQLIESQQDRLIAGRKTTVQVTNGSLFQDPQSRSMGLIIIPLVMGPMVLILIVACTNVIMLLLSRAAARRSEIAIRLALGAGRNRLLRMLATEGLIVAAVAGAVSVYLAYKLPGVFWAFLLQQTGYRAPRPDWMVFAYLAGVTLLAGCIVSLAPARESLKVDLLTSLKGREGATTARSRTRSILVITQVAMSFVLVAAGVLFARLQRSITSVDPGFETRRVFVVPMEISMPPYTQQSAANFYRAARDRVAELPGVRSASYTTVPPFSETRPEEIRVPGEAKGQGRQAGMLQVSTDFFSTLGIPIARGRAFRDSDATASANAAVAVVSQAFAADFWNAQSPLGKVVVMPDNTQLLVVGVAGNTKSIFGVSDGPRLYVLQNPRTFTGSLLVRFEGAARTLAPAIAKTIQGLDATQAVVPRTLQSMMKEKAEKIRPLTELILFMAFLALFLALSGVYGVVAFSMSQRTREFGIRMVLGAARSDILRSVLASGARQIAIGLSVGVLLALPAAFAFRGILGDSSVFDWSTYCAAALALTLAALCACYIPARRAMKVDPMVALRYE